MYVCEIKKADFILGNAGGYGTLEELLEVITWAQLGIHNKPVNLVVSPISSSL